VTMQIGLEKSKKSNDSHIDKRRLEAAKSIMTNLLLLRKSLTLYPPDHPRIIAGIDNLKGDLRRMLHKSNYISFNIYEHNIFFENELLESENSAMSDFIVDCIERGIDSFAFDKGVTTGELVTFLQLTSTNVDDLKSRGGIREELRRQNIVRITVTKLKVCANSSVPYQSDSKKSRSRILNVKIFDQALVKLNSIFGSLLANKDVNLSGTERLVNSLIEGILDDEDILTALTSLKKYSNYTCHHSLNVAILSLLLASKLELTKNELLTIGIGALLHDIGKLKIPNNIIEKMGSLTSQEWQLVKSHPIKSFDMLYNLPKVDPLIPVIAYEHHLGYDLSGYPKTKNIKKTHLFSRLVQIADSYDGATAHRSYHNPISPGLVLASMHKKSGSLFDPDLLRLFINTVGLYPIGSLVMISNGKIGIVVKNSPKDIMRPTVRVIADRQGAKIEEYLLDLQGIKGNDGPSIIGYADTTYYNLDIRNYLVNS